MKVIASDAAGNSSSDVSDNTFTIGQYCPLLPVVGFDANNDGILSLIDAVLLIKSSPTNIDEELAELNKENIERLLIIVFSNSE